MGEDTHLTNLLVVPNYLNINECNNPWMRYIQIIKMDITGSEWDIVKHYWVLEIYASNSSVEILKQPNKVSIRLVEVLAIK